jgi:hypothetical protein
MDSNQPLDLKPIQLALRTRLCLMAATIYTAQEMTEMQAAETALKLEHAVDRVLAESKTTKGQQ